MKTKIGIVILCYGKKNLTLACLDSLKEIRKKFISPQIILVDNKSPDDTVSVVIKRHPDVKIIENKANLGWSGGNNVGAKYALQNGAEYVLFLNNDTLVPADTIDVLIKKMRADKKIGLASPKIYLFPKKNKTIGNAGNFINEDFYGISLGAGEKDRGQFDNIYKTDFVAGTAICVSALVFKKIGYFDDKFFLYYEDVDFSKRAIRAGYKCVFIQNVFLYHQDSGTIGSHSPLHTYYNARNHLLFAEMYAPIDKLLIIYLKTARILLRQFRKRLSQRKYYALGVRDYILRRFGKRDIL